MTVLLSPALAWPNWNTYDCMVFFYLRPVIPSDASSIVYQPIYDVWSIEGGIQHTVTVYLSLVSNLLNLTWESIADIYIGDVRVNM